MSEATQKSSLTTGVNIKLQSLKLICGLLVLGFVKPITLTGREDRKRLELLRTEKCNDEVIDAWQELVSKPKAEMKKLLKEQADLLHRIAAKSCPQVADMEKEIEQSKEKLDKSALQALQALLGDHVIERYKESALDSFDPGEFLSKIDSSFRDILDNEMEGLTMTSSEIEEIIDKYIFSACSQYKTQMHKTFVKIHRISRFLGDLPYYKRQKKSVQDAVFRFQWCQPFISEEGLKDELKQRLLEEFDQVRSDTKRWMLLLEADTCTGEVIDAWFKLVNRPCNIDDYPFEKVHLLPRVARVTCPGIGDMEEEFVAKRKGVALDIEQLLSDELIMKNKIIHRETWLQPNTYTSYIDLSFLDILSKEPELTNKSPEEFRKIMNKYIYEPCAEYNKKMHETFTKLSRIIRFVSIERQKEAVQNGWYRFSWCQRLNTDAILKERIEYNLQTAFRLYEKSNFESDGSNKST